MSWHPNDLVSDEDLLAYERDILTRFNVTDWQPRREKVLEDWLWPQMRQAGYNPDRFRTRHAPEVVWSFTSSAYADITAAATDAASNDVALGAILAASADALVIGAGRQFRGVSMRLLDTVSVTPASVTVELWRDGWRSVAHTNGTSASGVPFAQGGALTWTVPPDWVMRPLSTNAAPMYYARVRSSAAPTGALAGQVAVIQRSVFSAPVTYRVLALIFREAAMQQDGPWSDRAVFYETEAALSLARALTLAGGEFDADDPSDDVLGRDDEAQTSASAGTPFRWERA